MFAMPMKRVALLTLVLCAAPAVALVESLNPATLHTRLADRTWMIMFAVTGCNHCKQMKPMWEEMERRLAAADADVFVGRVNSTKHNGLARTLRVNKFPTVLLIDRSGLVYEFTGRRGLPPLLEFAQGGYRTGAAHMMLPDEIQPDVSFALLHTLAARPRHAACVLFVTGCMLARRRARAGVRVLAVGRGAVAAAQDGDYHVGRHRARAEADDDRVLVVPEARWCEGARRWW